MQMYCGVKQSIYSTKHKLIKEGFMFRSAVTILNSGVGYDIIISQLNELFLKCDLALDEQILIVT